MTLRLSLWKLYRSSTSKLCPEDTILIRLFYYYMNSTKKKLFPPFLPKMLIIAVNVTMYLLFLSYWLICSGRFSWEDKRQAYICFCVLPCPEILYSSLWEEQKKGTHSSLFSSAVTQLGSRGGERGGGSSLTARERAAAVVEGGSLGCAVSVVFSPHLYHCCSCSLCLLFC